METVVFNIEGKETGKTVQLSEAVFGLETPNDHAIYQDVRLILANKRQGTHKAKERSEIKGTRKKPFRQKGTGNARQGSRQSPLWRHGARVFGPKPRSYGFRLNKKVKSLARKSALTYKAKEEKIKVLENFEMEQPRTKDYLGILSNLNIGDSKSLLVLHEDNPNIYLSGRNLPKVKICTVDSLNTYDILNAEELLFTEAAVSLVNEKLA